MSTRIEKDGDEIKLVVTTPGYQDQVFKGKTHEEVLLKLGKAQEDASRKILEQKLALKTSRPDVDPAKPSPTFQPKPMSAVEQINVGKDFADPLTAKAAFDKMVESTFGAHPEQVRQTLTQAQQIIEREQNSREAAQFMREHPEYKPTPDNEKKIFDYLESHDMALTARNCAIAYEDLKEFLELKDSAAHQPLVVQAPKPEEIPPAEPTARPRAAMTGLPAGRSVATPPSNRSGVLTDEEFMQEVHRLNPAQYRERIGNPNFRARVDKIMAQRQAPRTQ